MPYGAPAVAETKSGTRAWPDGIGTNTYSEKVTGGPWVDVVVDATEPHPLYVRTVAKWDEWIYERADSGDTHVVTNWRTVDQFLYLTNTYQFIGTGNSIDTSQASYHLFSLYAVTAGPEPPEGFSFDNGDRVRTERIDLGNPSDVPKSVWPVVKAGATWWNNQGVDEYEVRYQGARVVEEPETAFPYKPRTYYWRKYLYDINEGTETVPLLVDKPVVKRSRMHEAYEPIQAAGVRHWADVAVSTDTTMRNMWAIETDGHAWRMQGRSWRDGAWTKQDGPGTNHWKQVLCSTDGKRALVLGEHMMPAGYSDGDGEAAANAWYFDGDVWTAIACPKRIAGGQLERVKWKKAFLSQDGYTGYLLQEGMGEVFMMKYE